jgi:hypothetical protein
MSGRERSEPRGRSPDPRTGSDRDLALAAVWVGAVRWAVWGFAGCEGAAGGGDDGFDASAVDAAQASFFVPGHAWMVGLDGGAEAFEGGDDSLPGVGDSGWVWGDQAEGGAAGEGFAQAEAGADAVGFGGGRGFADQGLAADLWCEGQRAGCERVSAARGDGELKSWEEDADDH